MGCFIMDDNTNEILHYTQSKSLTNTIDCGVYLFSSEIYRNEEFGQFIRKKFKTTDANKIK